MDQSCEGDGSCLAKLEDCNDEEDYIQHENDEEFLTFSDVIDITKYRYLSK